MRAFLGVNLTLLSANMRSKIEGNVSDSQKNVDCLRRPSQRAETRKSKPRTQPKLQTQVHSSPSTNRAMINSLWIRWTTISTMAMMTTQFRCRQIPRSPLRSKPCRARTGWAPPRPARDQQESPVGEQEAGRSVDSHLRACSFASFLPRLSLFVFCCSGACCALSVHRWSIWSCFCVLSVSVFRSVVLVPLGINSFAYPLVHSNSAPFNHTLWSVSRSPVASVNGNAASPAFSSIKKSAMYSVSPPRKKLQFPLYRLNLALLIREARRTKMSFLHSFVGRLWNSS